MATVSGASGDPHFFTTPVSAQVDFSNARSAYEKAIDNPEERHAEVGILSPNGAITFEKLGKDEEYGAHRVGSVTKTFTAFLALKLANDKDKVLPNGLQTRCGDIIKPEILAQVFEDPETAQNMTLEELLSHTSGLEFDDHCYQPNQKLSSTPPSTLQERFIQEGTMEGGRKYKHVSKPGEGIGFYSNAGLAVAGWMLEAAYNEKHPGKELPFSQIMKQELFEGVFKLSESFIGTGPTGDIIQSACGDMSTTTKDLMKVAVRLQKGQNELESDFGTGWQSTMLQPRDIFEHHGLGCKAFAPVIQHAGLNREKFGTEERDVTAVVQFPLGPNEPGLVAMCDSSALGPAPREQDFIRALEATAGISHHEEPEPRYDLDFFCPPNGYLFHGYVYLATNVDPFAQDPPDTIICSRSGMKHVLTRISSPDETVIRRYIDKDKNPWLFISREDGRKLIYSDLCLCNKALGVNDLASLQPNAASIKGVYRDAEKPKEHPTFEFIEKQGHLYMREGGDQDFFPCLYIPDDSGGSWAVSNPGGRSLKIRFPQNPDEEFLTITDTFSGVQVLPLNSRRVP